MLKTPNMGLTLLDNTNKITQEPGTYGQNWADIINRNRIIIDAHDHNEFNGVKINSSELVISDDFDVNGYGIENITSISLVKKDGYTPQNNSFYTDNTDLYYQDGNGNTVRFTQSGTIVTPSFKGFSGDFVSSNAAVVYDNNNRAYYFYNNNSAGFADIVASNYIVSNLIIKNNLTFNASNGFTSQHIVNNGITQSDINKFYILYNPSTVSLSFNKMSSTSNDPGSYVYVDNDSSTCFNTFIKDIAGAHANGNFPLYGDYATNYNLNGKLFRNRIKIQTKILLLSTNRITVTFTGYILSFHLICKSTNLGQIIINNIGGSNLGQYYCQTTSDGLNMTITASSYVNSDDLTKWYSHYFLMYLEPY